jgi:hypothetical protein
MTDRTSPGQKQRCDQSQSGLFDGSHGDVDRAFDTMTGWLEHYNKSAAEPIRYLVVGFWDPEENLPPARLPQ